MSKWEMQHFESILSIVNGRNQKNVENPNGKYPIYGSGGIMGYADDYICEKNTVIIGRKGNINKPIFVNKPFWNVDTAFGLVANKDRLLPKYLYYFCLNYDFLSLNTTVTIPSLTKSNLLKIKIPLPSLAMQQKIAYTLDTAADLLALRKHQLAELDALIQSVFVEMFGDPLLNPIGWKSVQLTDIAEIVSGITKGRKIKEQELFEVPYMRVGNVKDGHIDLTEIKTIEATQSEIERYTLKFDDVLMTEGGDPDKLGRGAIWQEKIKNCIHQNHIFRVRVKQKYVLPQYFAEYLRYPKAKRYFLSCAKQTTGIASINMTQLRLLPVLLPHIELQNKFVTIVERIEQQKALVKQAIDQTQNLFDSLMAEYFE